MMNGKGSSRKIKAEPGIKHEQDLDVDIRRPSKPRRSWSAWVINNFSRLCIWYAIFTVLFRCPTSPNDLTPSSSYLCKPYIQARTFVAPHISPYYDKYAAPYVEIVSPYAETFYAKVYTPAVGLTRDTYVAYGEPRVTQAQAYLQKEWDRTIKPRLDETKSVAQKQYDASLAPYVNQASEKVEPHIRNAQVIATRQYYSTIRPSYEKSLPYVWLAYDRVYFVTTEYIYPYSSYAARYTFDFLSRRVWPRLRIVYGENVEPQLVKIKERLANYRESKQIQSIMDDVDSSTQIPIASDISSSIKQSIESYATPSPSSDEKAASVVEEEKAQITAELERWQEKFARASDKGAQDLKVRVEEITSRQIQHQAHGVGEALVTELDESVKKSIKDLRSAIIKIVKDVPEEPTNENISSAEEAAQKLIRNAGGVIKEKAQSLRSWRVKFDEETTRLVKSATDSTLDVVDNIRDLGLQEIGMRWASMDTVTYQDWSKYHSLKKAVDEWRGKVEDVALSHEGLKSAKRESDDIESRGMATAEDAAKELRRLKDVATWKIRADDSSDDFGTKAIPAVAAKLAQKVQEKFEDASEAVLGSSQGVAESVSSRASEAVESAASSVSSIAADPPASKASSSVSKAVESAASRASAKIADPPQSKAASSVSSAANVAASSASSAAENVEVPASKSAQSAASEVSESARSASSSIDNGQASSVSKSVSSAYSEASKKAESSASSASNAISSASSAASKDADSTASSVSKSAASAAYAADQKVISPASEKVASVSSAAAAHEQDVSTAVESASIAASKKLTNIVDRVAAASAEHAANMAASAASAASSASSSVGSVATSKQSTASSDVSSVVSSASSAASVTVDSASLQSSDVSSSLSSAISSIKSKRSAEASAAASSISSEASTAATKRPPSGFAMAQGDTDWAKPRARAPSPASSGGRAADDDDDDSDSEDEEEEVDTRPEPTNEAELAQALSEAMSIAKAQAASITDDAFSKASSDINPAMASESGMEYQSADIINGALQVSKELMKAASDASTKYSNDFMEALSKTKSSLASEASEASRRAAARPTEHPEL